MTNLKTSLNEYVGAPPIPEVKRKRKPEKIDKDYFLITYQEGGDETHFMLMDMVHYDVVEKAIPKLADGGSKDIKFSTHQKYVEGLMMFCEDSQTLLPGRTTPFWIQTYCDEEWPFGEYNIVRIISIPEFGT